MVSISQLTSQLSTSTQSGLNWSSVGAALLSFFDVIHGPLAAGASALSMIWLGLQIYSWVEKRRKK